MDAQTDSPSPGPAPGEDRTGSYRAWRAAAIALGVVSVVSVPLAVYVFLAPGHLGVPYEGRLAWLCGVPVWGAVECVRKARAARAGLR
ncbi:MAG TPA: hypothetical protein VF902_08640 [Coriobacteriia bacterium]